MDALIRPSDEGGDNAVALFLGLYLVVLAFFILLVSISTMEVSKSKKAMDSVSSAFTSVVSPSTSLNTFNVKDGDILAGQEFQQQITGIFSTKLGLDKVKVIQPGRQMRLFLNANSFFFTGQSKIRPAMYPLLNRTVAALSNRPPGLRYDMEFVIGTPTLTDGKIMPITQTLAVARVGAFARAMHNLGIPPDSLAVGMRPGHVGEIVIWFYTRDIQADRLRFGPSPKAKQ